MGQQQPSMASQKRKPSTESSTTARGKRIQLSAGHSDLDNMNPSATDSTSTASSAVAPSSPPAPALLESIPQDIFDEISKWLTGADAKNLCLTSKTLHKAFAHRKWAALYVDYAIQHTGHGKKSEIDFLNFIQADNEWNSGGTTAPGVPRTHIPAVNYIRQASFTIVVAIIEVIGTLTWSLIVSVNRKMIICHRDLGAARTSQETEGWSEVEGRDQVRNILAILSALPKLQELFLDINLLHMWGAVSKPDLLQVLKNHRTWDSIRFLNIWYWHSSFPTADQIDFLREIFKSHLPNLAGLKIHEEYLYWRPWQSILDQLMPPALTRSIQLQPTSSLRRLHLLVSDVQRSPEIAGLVFDLDLLQRITQDFGGLEWLAINPQSVFAVDESNFSIASAHSRRRRYYEIVDKCIEHLKHMTSLKRLSLPLFFHVHNTYLELDIATFANKFLDQMPNLEQVCISVRWYEYLELDRNLAPNGYRWVSLSSPENVFASCSGVWPAGMRAVSHLEAKSPFD